MLKSYKNNVILGGLKEIETMVKHQNEWRNQTFAFWTHRIGNLILHGGKNFWRKVFANDTMRLLQDDYKVQFDHILVSPGSFIFEPLNDFILSCHQHGFTNYFQRAIFNKKFGSVVYEASRKVLTMDMLSAGFLLWLCCVGISFLVFIIEHCVRYFTRTRKLPYQPKVMKFYDELAYDR